MNIETDCGANAYASVLTHLHKHGKKVGKFIEDIDLNITIHDPDRGEPTSKKMFWGWAVIECFERLASNYENPGVAWMLRPTWRRKLEKEGGVFCYSYGESLQEQIPVILTKLRKRTEREAIFTIWTREHLDARNFQRRPCTLTIHPYLSEGRLHMWVAMRSSDVANLLSYDLFHHSFLQRYLAAKLDVPLGYLYFKATHFYIHQKRHDPAKLKREIDAINQRTYTADPKLSDFGEIDESITMAYQDIVNALDPTTIKVFNDIPHPLIKIMRDAVLLKLKMQFVERTGHHWFTLVGG